MPRPKTTVTAVVVVESSFSNLMQHWLRCFWSRACCYCSAWHYSEGAETSLEDAHQDQPNPARCNSLRRDPSLEQLFTLMFTLNTHAHLTAFTLLLGGGSGRRTRTETRALRGQLFPRETRLLLQLALRHKHTH